MRIRILDPEKGDQMVPELVQPEMTPVEATDFLMAHRKKGRIVIGGAMIAFGVFEGDDTQLELEMATRTGILESLTERDDQILRLVPVVSGG